jgi:hypothetical protein
MERKIYIFKTFKEQELHQLQQLQKTTEIQRLQNLFYMQNFSRKKNPPKNKTKTLTFINGYITS